MSINLGNIVGSIKSENEPTKTFVLWAKILNIAFPDIVEFLAFNGDTGQWEPLQGDGKQQFIEFQESVSNEYDGVPGFTMNSYEKGSHLIATFDTTNTGPVDVDVNSLTDRDVKKHDGAGGIVELVAGDLQADIPYIIVDDGVQYIVVAGIAASGGIYSGNGALSGATTVTMATNDLGFNSTGISNLFYIDATNDTVGVGTVPDTNTNLHVKGTFSSTLKVERETSLQDTFSTLVVKGTKTSDMSDGFGAGIAFQIEDNAAVVNAVGVITGYRDGADDTGALGFDVFNGAVRKQSVVRINSSENMMIGFSGLGAITDLSTRLVVKGVDTGSTNFAFKALDGSLGNLMGIRNDGNVGIGQNATAPTQQVEVVHNQNALTALFVTNTTDGTAAQAAIRVTSNTATFMQLQAVADTNSVISQFAGSVNVFASGGANELAFAHDTASGKMTWRIGGSVNTNANRRRLTLGFVSGEGDTWGLALGNNFDPSAKLHMGGENISRSAWGLTGDMFRQDAKIHTDNSTAGSGTATNAVINSIEIPTIAATNSSVTTTNAATWYIAGAPAAGTNMTLTNSYSIWVDDGLSRFDGVVQLPEFIVASLPANTSGGVIMVTDETGGYVMAFNDGTNWRRVTDRVIVS